MPKESFTKLELAEQQLQTAIGLFLTNADRISSITLAGAADGILHGLVISEGKQPFADYALATAEVLSGVTPAKSKYARHINDELNINTLKHMDKSDAKSVSFDPDLSALGAILKAIANHHQLVPEHPPFINSMLQWTWQYYDGEKIIMDGQSKSPPGQKIVDNFDKRPKKIKEMEGRLAKK